MRQKQPPATSPLRMNARETLAILLAPIIGFFLLHYPVVHQNGYLDPYFYTGFIQNFSDLFHRYGLTYYGVRFGLLLPSQFLNQLFGPLAGYLILRYLLTLAVGFSLHAAVKRWLSAPAAMATALVGMTSPFLARSVLWNHPDATAATLLTVAVCWSLLASDGGWRRALLAGVALGIAVNSNIFTLVIFALFVAVYVVLGRAHGLAFRHILRQLTISAAGALAVTLGGALYYWTTVGQWDIFSITLTTARSLSAGGMAAWRTPGCAWILSQPHVLIPVWLSVWAIVGIRTWRASLGPSVMAAFGCTVTAFFFVHQFLLGADTLQLWYYFAYSAPALFFLFALLCDRLWRASQLAPGLFVAVTTACCAAPWIAFSFGARLDWLLGFRPFLMAAAASLLAGFLAQRKGGRASSRVPGIAAVLLAGCAFVGGFVDYGAPSRGSRMVRRWDARGNPELDVYRAALEFIREMPRLEQSGATVFWYDNQPLNYFNSVQSTYLWGYSKLTGSAAGDPGLPILKASEAEILQSGRYQTVALMAGSPEELEAAFTALRERRLLDGNARRREIVSGDYRFYWALIDLRTHHDAAF